MLLHRPVPCPRRPGGNTYRICRHTVRGAIGIGLLETSLTIGKQSSIVEYLKALLIGTCQDARATTNALVPVDEHDAVLVSRIGRFSSGRHRCRKHLHNDCT